MKLFMKRESGIRLIVLLGIAGIAALGTVGCEKEDDIKTQILTETKHDTVYVNKTDTINSVRSDTIYLPGDTIYTPKDTIYTPKDTIYIPGDTIYLAGDTIYIPNDTIYIPGDTIYIPNDTIYIPGDTVYTKPDTIYTPSKPDTIYTPSKPDTIYIPSKPDTVYVPVIPHHNTTYIWGDNNWDAIWPETTDNVAKSADSTLVDKVILKNDGRSLGGISTSDLMSWINTVVESVSPTKRYKVRGSGTLEETSIGNQQDIQDSIRLSNFGFDFGRVVYSDKLQR
jgi:signal peptidase I